jgi:hypothetical protein
MPQLPTRRMYAGHQDANTINQRIFICLFPDYHRGLMPWRMYMNLYRTSPPSPQISLAGAGIIHGYNCPTGREELMDIVKPKCVMDPIDLVLMPSGSFVASITPPHLQSR